MTRSLLTRLLLVVGALALVACNPDNNANGSSDTGPDILITPDAGDVGADITPDATPDVAPDVDTSPDVPEDIEPDLEPSEPELLVVKINPARPVFPVGLLLTPTATVYDQRADEMPDLPINWTVSPANAATPQGEGFMLEREGTLTIRGCTPLNEDATLNLCGEREVVVDAGAPTLEIYTPTPGTELVSTEHPVITVTGRASDTNGTVRVYVEGTRAQLDSEGNFSVDVRPVYGINHISVVASDGLNSLATKRGVDVMWAPRYHPITTNPIDGTIAGDYPQALLLRLNQRYLDADERIVIPPEDPTLVAGDIAGLLQFVLGEIDLMSYIPNPVSDSSSFYMEIPFATLGEPNIDIRVTRDGLEIFVSIPAFEVETDGAITLTDTPLSLDGRIGLTVSAFIDLRIEKQTAEDPLVVEARTIEVALEDARGEFEEEELNAIIELAEGLLFATLEDIVLDTLQEAFLDELPALLEDALGSIEGSLIEESIELDLGLGGDPVSLNVAASLNSLVPEARSGLQIDIGVGMGTTATPVHPESRGIAMDVPFDREAPLFASSRIQIGVRVPLLNGIMHALWNSGLLEIDATDLIPPELAFVIQGAELTGLLPPHITPTRPDNVGYQFIMNVGQLEMEIWRADLRDRVGINVQVGVNIDVVGNALSVEVAPEPDVTMWMIEQMGPRPLFDNVEALQSLFIGAIWPMVTEQLEEGLFIELPAIDLSSIGDLAPRLSDLTLNLVLDNPVEIREGYFIIDGAFEGVADLSE